MKIYLDVCCINRPFDDQSQPRIHLEAEAVVSILKYIDDDSWHFVSSDVVTHEIKKTVDIERRERLFAISNKAQHYITVTDSILRRTKAITALGFNTYDAMHIACAEKAKVDAFLTTDDKLINCATRNTSDLLVLINNPLNWLQQEILK